MPGGRNPLRREIRIVLPGAREDRWAALGLAALIVFVFRQAVFGGQVLFIRDIGMVWYPQIESFVRCIASGSWPLWDVHRGFGQPLLADPSSQVLYPPTWLNLLIRPWHYYTLFAVSHLLTSACGMYLLARRWSCTRAGAFVAGAVWSLSGPLLSLVSLWHHFASASWIPWVFLAADKSLSSGKASHAVLWGGITALQILAGSADMVAITGVAVVAYAATCHVRWRSPHGGVNKSLARSAMLAALIALGLTAVLWMPTLAIARESLRWHLPAASRTTWSLHPLGLLGLVCLVHWGDLPQLFGDYPSLRDLQAPFLYSIYLGGPAGAFVAAALAMLPLPRKRFLAFLGLGALLIALGRYGGAYDVASLFPPLRILRFPVKWVILTAFSWSVLAGMGFDAWRRPETRADPRWTTCVALPMLLLAAFSLGGGLVVHARGTLASLAGTLLVSGGLFSAAALVALARRRWELPGLPGLAPALAIAILALGELAIRQEDIQPFAPRDLFAHRPEVLDLLDTSGHARLYVYDYAVAAYEGQNAGKSGWGYRLARAPGGFSRQGAQALGVQMYLSPPTAGRWGLYGSYDVDLLGLYPEPLSRLTKFLRRAEGRPAHLRLLRMGGVRYVLALHRERWWDDLLPHGSVPGLLKEPIQVFRVPDPLPRAYVVSGARVADGDSALAVFDDPSFDPAREVILPEGRPRAPLASFAGSSHISLLDPDRVLVEADLPQAGYLVLVDGYDSGWRARVDGQDAPILRANIAFRAVPLPAGRHAVELVYRPRPVIHGLLISAGTAVLALSLVLSRRRADERVLDSGPTLWA